MIKNLIFIIILQILGILMSGCTQNSTDPLPTETTTDRGLLETLGYKTEGMIERGDFYLLLPDIVISKEELTKLRNTPSTRMQRGYGLLDEQYQTIYLDDTRITNYSSLLTHAVEEWNKIPNSNIRFIFDKTATPVVKFHGEMAGEPFDPVGIQPISHIGQYTQSILLNYSKVLPLLGEPTRGKYFMMHILGHIAGFGHAETDPFAMPDDNYINGTIISDPASIMRNEKDILYGRDGEKWNGFSEWDIKAIQYLYPFKEKATFNLSCTPQGTGTNASTLVMGTTYVFTAVYKHSNYPNPKYKITISKTSGRSTVQDYEYIDSGNGIFSIRFLKSGNYKVSVVATNVPQNNNTVEQTYTVKEVTPSYSLTCNPTGTGTDKNNIILGTKYYFTAKYSHPSSPDPKFDFEILKTGGGANDYLIETLENGKISVVFYQLGEYKIHTDVTNILNPLSFDQVYFVVKEYDLECTPPGTGIDGKTLQLERKYLFTPKNNMATSNSGFELIDIEKNDNGPGIGEGTDFDIHFDLPIQDLAQGKFQVTFHAPGQYRITMGTPNSVSPAIEFEETYFVPKAYSLECKPSGTGTDGKTLKLEQKYSFTPKCTQEENQTTKFEFIDIEKGHNGPGTGEGTDFEIYFDPPIQDIARGIFQVRFHTPGQYRIIIEATKNNITSEFEEIYSIQ